MSAYKKLNKQDAYITTYVAHKPWAILNSDYTTYGIETIYTGTSLQYSSSLNQLYYPSKSLSTGNIVSHSFDYYNQTTLFNADSRKRPTGTRKTNIISIPRALFGTNMQPGKVVIVLRRPDKVFIDVIDDGEGGLYLQNTSPKVYVGDVIYSHGIATITQGVYTTYTVYSTSFNSSQPIYTHNYHCKIRESEYNYTYNPSALSGSRKTVYDNTGNVYSTSASISDGVLRDNITGSSFQPYITTVGLYNDTNELIAVAKMGQPVPKPANTEMTIVVKIDI